MLNWKKKLKTKQNIIINTNVSAFIDMWKKEKCKCINACVRACVRERKILSGVSEECQYKHFTLWCSIIEGVKVLLL